MWSGYTDWESANEDSLYDRGACWAEELKKQREEAEKARPEQEAEKQRKIQEAEDYIKSHNLYQVKVAGGLVQLSFLPQDDAEKEKLQKKSKEITIEEYENLAFIPYPYPIKDENDDPYMQR